MAKRHWGRPHQFLLMLAIASLFFCSSLLNNPVEATAPTYNVRSFGATGNGTTDDSQAIANALAVANQHPGSTVIFPSGTYLIGSASPILTANSVNLAGKSNAVLSMSATNACVVLTGQAPSLRNLTINSTGATAAVSVQNATNFIVYRNSFSGFSNVAINEAQNNSSGSVVQNVLSIPGGATGFEFSGSSAYVSANTFNATTTGSGMGVYSSYAAGSLSVLSNTFNSLGYAFNGNFSAGTCLVSNNKFSNCTFAANCNGLNSLTFNNNTITATSIAQTAGFFSFIDSAFITGNTISGPANSEGILAAFDDKMFISNNSITLGANSNPIYCQYNDSVAINSNQINCTAATSSVPGIVVFSCANATVSQNRVNAQEIGILTQSSNGVTISNNYVQNIQKSGILNQMVAAPQTITGNHLSNCGLSGAAAVIDLESSHGTPINITNNSYTGNANNLSYFIYESTGTATLSGNTTNTMLPDYPQ